MLQIFRRKSHPEASSPADNLLMLPVGAEEPDPNRPHLYGQYDGGLAVENDVFAEFLQAASRREHLAERITALLEQRHQIQEQLRQAEAAHISAQTLPERLQALERALPEARQRHEQLRQQREACEKELETLHQSHEAYSLVQMLMYGTAGLAFLLGDIIVSKEIVAQVLYLPLEYERWLFAVGLACITFVLKVAYDRLVELPFWQRVQKRFEVVILSISTLALITLIFMGALRTQEIQRQHMLRSTEQTTWSLEADAPSIQQEIPGPDGTVLLVTFMLAAVMFATAGAVCFSTAHTHARGYFHRYRPLRQKCARLSDQEREAALRLETLEENLTRGREELARATATLALVGTPEVLRQDLQKLEDRIAQLQDQLADLLVAQRQASYRSGRERALHYQRLLASQSSKEETDELPDASSEQEEHEEAADALPEATAAQEMSEKEADALIEMLTAQDNQEDATSTLPEVSVAQNDREDLHEAEAATDELPGERSESREATPESLPGEHEAAQPVALTVAHSDAAPEDSEAFQTGSNGAASPMPIGSSVTSDVEGESAAVGGDGAERSTERRSRRERGVRHGLRRPFLDIRDEILDLTA